MATDFRAQRIRANALIVSKSDAGGPSLLIYSASGATNFTGGKLDPNMLAGVGTDTLLFVSGTRTDDSHGMKRGVAGSAVTLFGGDIIVSGTLYAERQVIEVDETITGSLSLSGSLFVSASAKIMQGMEVNLEKSKHATNDFIVHSSKQSKEMITTNLYHDVVMILSGAGSIYDPNELDYTDMSFFVSGSSGSRARMLAGVVGDDPRGVSVFGGDVHISGSATDEAGTLGNWTLVNLPVPGYVYPTTPYDYSVDPPAPLGARNVFVGGDFTDKTIQLSAGGSAAFNLKQDSGGIFQVYGYTDQNLVYVKAYNDRVGIGTNDPDTKLEIKSNAAGGQLKLKYATGQAYSFQADPTALTIGSDSGTGDIRIQDKISHVGDPDTYFSFHTNQDLIDLVAGGINFVKIQEDPSQNWIFFNVDNADVDFVVSTLTETNALYVKGEANWGVGIGTNAPAQELHVDGTVRISDGASDWVELRPGIPYQGDLRIDTSGGPYGDGSVVIPSKLACHADYTTHLKLNSGGIELVAGAVNILSGGNGWYGDGPFVSILSGSASSEFDNNEESYRDTAFFVSGSIGSKNRPVGLDANTRPGVALFGGDVAVSGALYLEKYQGTGGAAYPPTAPAGSVGLFVADGYGGLVDVPHVQIGSAAKELLYQFGIDADGGTSWTLEHNASSINIEGGVAIGTVADSSSKKVTINLDDVVGLVPATYTNPTVQVDQQGRVVTISNGSGGGGAWDIGWWPNPATGAELFTTGSVYIGGTTHGSVSAADYTHQIEMNGQVQLNMQRQAKDFIYNIAAVGPAGTTSKWGINIDAGASTGHSTAQVGILADGSLTNLRDYGKGPYYEINPLDPAGTPTFIPATSELGQDVAFYVSGTIGGRGIGSTTNTGGEHAYGISMFGGDMHVSGVMSIGRGLNVNEDRNDSNAGCFHVSSPFHNELFQVDVEHELIAIKTSTPGWPCDLYVSGTRTIFERIDNGQNDGYMMYFSRARINAPTYGPAKVQNEDEVGTIEWNAHNGSSYETVARVRAIVDDAGYISDATDTRGRWQLQISEHETPINLDNLDASSIDARGRNFLSLCSGSGGAYGSSPHTMSPNEYNFADVAIFNSGGIHYKNNPDYTGNSKPGRGVALFGGDVAVSGAVYFEELVSSPYGTLPDGQVALYGKASSGTTKLYFKHGSTETEVGAGGGGMASFSVKGDTGTPQTITNNDAVNFAGGTGIETAGVTTDTISITLNANLDDLADVVAGAATNDVLTWQGSSWKAAPPGALATAAGDNTSGGGTKGQIQFNDGTNAFDANEGLFWTSEEGLHVSGSSTSTYDAAITIPTAKKLVFNGGANPPDIFIEADTTYGLKIDGDNYVDIYSDVQTRFMGNGDVIVNYNMGSAATTRIQGDTKRGLVLADASTEQIAIGVPALTSPYDASVAYDSYYNDSIGERPIPEDTGLFVSGSVWGKGKVLGDGIKGVATFGGDLLTSGALWFERKPAGITLPGTLPGNSAVMYAREDTGKTKLFYMDDTGVEHELGAGGMTSFSVDANSSQAGATTISNSQILTVQGGTGISTYIPQAILRRVEISLDADLADLNDVDAATPTNGQALVWDQGKGWWEPGLPAGNMGQQFTSGTVAGRTYSIEGPDIFENLDIQTLGENGTSQWALFNDRQKLDVQEFTIINHNNFGRGAQCQTRQKTEMPDGVEFRMDVPPGATHVKFIVWYFIDSVPTQATKIDLRFAGRMASDFGQAVPGQGAGGPQGGKTPASPDPFEWMDSAAQLSHADSPGWAEFYAGGVPLTLGGPASNMQRATTSDGNTEWMTLAKMINSHDAALFSAASSRIIDVMLVRGSAGASGQSACDIFANPGSSTESNDSYADSIWISAVQALFTTI